MDKNIVVVPKGVRYLSDWEAFTLPEYRCIIDKQTTGCGFTEWCIRSEKPIILCSPRKILLQNKVEQHPGEVYYARNESSFQESLGIDYNLLKRKM
jgi:GH24 family phage-related lysozyme (muramidase)